MCCNPESPFWRQFRPAVEPLEGRITLDGAEPPATVDPSWCEVADAPEPSPAPAPDDNADPADAPLEEDPGDYPGDYPPPPPPLDPVAPGPAGPA